MINSKQHTGAKAVVGFERDDLEFACRVLFDLFDQPKSLSTKYQLKVENKNVFIK